MEDLIVRHDGTVRNSMEHIIQFQYGEDSLDPCSLEVQGFDGMSTGASLFEWTDDELAEQYDRTQRFMPNTLNPQRFATFLAIENKKLAEDLIFLTNFFERSTEKTLLSPVNIDRLIKRIKYEKPCTTGDEHNIFEFDDGFMLNPLYISGQIELMKLNIFTFILPNGNREYRENKLFEMLLRDKLHPRRIMYQYKLDLKQFHVLLQYIRDTYMNSFVQPGEMVGTIAAQSIGEPAQQMTLNSKYLSFFSGVYIIILTLFFSLPFGRCEFQERNTWCPAINRNHQLFEKSQNSLSYSVSQKRICQ
jgi:DNA-directed RNA polymerase II subunit RPB1